MSLSTAPVAACCVVSAHAARPLELAAIAAWRKRVGVVLSQVRRPEISSSKRLDELGTLCEESIEGCIGPSFLMRVRYSEF
jgi:hypothetical protein